MILNTSSWHYQLVLKKQGGDEKKFIAKHQGFWKYYWAVILAVIFHWLGFTLRRLAWVLVHALTMPGRACGYVLRLRFIKPENKCALELIFGWAFYTVVLDLGTHQWWGKIRPPLYQALPSAAALIMSLFLAAFGAFMAFLGSVLLYDYLHKAYRASHQVVEPKATKRFGDWLNSKYRKVNPLLEYREIKGGGKSTI
jgi:hypothetical protein